MAEVSERIRKETVLWDAKPPGCTKENKAGGVEWLKTWISEMVRNKERLVSYFACMLQFNAPKSYALY